MKRLAVWMTLAGCASASGEVESPEPHLADVAVAGAMAGSPAAGVPCSTGCSGSSPDELAHLGDEAIVAMLGEVAAAPVGAGSLAAETLLFHAVEAQDHLDRIGAGPLSAAHEAWLRTELARDEVEIGLRLVASDGALLGHREDVIPLAEKQHLRREGMGPLGRADVNGKVKRVGVRHLWARF